MSTHPERSYDIMLSQPTQLNQIFTSVLASILKQGYPLIRVNSSRNVVELASKEGTIKIASHPRTPTTDLLLTINTPNQPSQPNLPKQENLSRNFTISVSNPPIINNLLTHIANVTNPKGFTLLTSMYLQLQNLNRQRILEMTILATQPNKRTAKITTTITNPVTGRRDKRIITLYEPNGLSYDTVKIGIDDDTFIFPRESDAIEFIFSTRPNA